jgi:nanoRNase/pAp phosphatase (c-di-AMP/oligoRNAs hydrolase)
MSSRLVLGTASLGRQLLATLKERPGELHLVTPDEYRLDTLRGADVEVSLGDPSDPATLSELAIDPETVIIASEEAVMETARHVRETYPGAMILTYLPPDLPDGDRRLLDTLVDRVVEPTQAVATSILETVGDAGMQLRQLQRVLRDVDGELAIVTHDNPDPDAIASAIALQRVAAAVGCPADVCYYGTIAHQENRAFVNVLEFEMVNVDPEDDLDQYGAIALVDHSRPGVNDQLPEDTPVDIVIDHHPPRVPIEARFVDLRSEVGATSTLMTDYVRQILPQLDPDVATGLLFGIRIDTDEFSREVAVADFEAAAYLLESADLEVLRRIETPSMSRDTVETIGRAIRNRRHEGTVLLSCVGELTDRDALAQAADRLLGLEGVSTTLVYGVMEGTIFASARARGTELDLGEVMREAFGQIGSAGGHADMAGAQITLGVLDEIEEKDPSLAEIVRDVVDDRFLETIDTRTQHTFTSVFAPTGQQEGSAYHELPDQE